MEVVVSIPDLGSTTSYSIISLRTVIIIIIIIIIRHELVLDRPFFYVLRSVHHGSSCE
jgi:hypothetical protein